PIVALETILAASSRFAMPGFLDANGARVTFAPPASSRVEACDLLMWSGAAFTLRAYADGSDRESVHYRVTHNWVATQPQITTHFACAGSAQRKAIVGGCLNANKHPSTAFAGLRDDIVR